MKLTNIALIALALLLVIPAAGLFNAPVKENTVFGTRAYTHTVFVEDLTATWCQYCPSASENLKALHDEGSRDFNYVCLITDMNQDAADRATEYNPSGYPTVEFDGGYKEVIGAQTDSTTYATAIDDSGAREPASIGVTLQVIDQGSSNLDVSATVTNTGTTAYSGTLKVYITEKESRYNDYDGNKYPYGMIGFAINEAVSVPASDEVTKTATWSGADQTDLLSNDYSDIDPSNIEVFAVVLNSEMHRTIRSGATTAKFYNAYYVDASTAGEPQAGGSGPQVSISSPSKYSTQSGTVDVKAQVTSSTDISSVKVKIDSGSYMDMTKSGENYVYSWDTTKVSDGTHTLSVQATDVFSATATASISVKVGNGGPASGVTIENVKHTPTAPNNLDEITITCQATSDAGTITSVAISVCEGTTCQLPTEMSGIGDNTYEYKIGPYTTGADVSYSITAKDSKGNTKTIEKVHIIIADSGVSDDDAVTDDDTVEKKDTPGFEAVGLIFIVAMIVGALYMIRRKL